MHPGEKFIAYFLTILAGISLGAIPIISAIMRDNNFFTLEQVMLRLLFGALFSTIILLYFSVRKNKNQVWLDKNVQLGYFIQGIVLVFQFYVYLGAIVIGTPAGEVALLVQIHPIVTLLIGWLFLNELITKEKSLAVLLAIIGIIILAQPWNWNRVFNYWLGDLMALSNGFLYGIYIILGRNFNSIRKNIPATISISWVLIWTFINGMILTFFVNFFPLSEEFKLFRLEKIISIEGVGFGIIFSLFGSIIPYGLIMYSAKSIESSKASILLLGEAISAVILANLILHEPITVNYAIGGIIIFLAIIIIVDPMKISNNKKNGQLS